MATESSLKFAIVTDTAADIPEELKSLPGFYVVNNFIIIDGQDLIEGRDITRSELLLKLSSGTFAKTSQASVEEMQTKYSKALEEYPEVLGIHVGSKLSGVMNNANVAKKRLGDKVTLFDTSTVSIGITFLLELAFECRNRGMSLNETIQKLELAKLDVHVQVMLGNLDYVKHGGRIPKGQFFFLNLLNIKPILTVKDGLIEKAGGALGRGMGIKKLYKRAINLSKGYQDPYICIGAVNADYEQDQLITKLETEITFSKMRYTGLSAVIIAHVGPYAIGYAIAPSIQSYFTD
jgi:DegV family protein with EDD domain